MAEGEKTKKTGNGKEILTEQQRQQKQQKQQQTQQQQQTKQKNKSD